MRDYLFDDHLGAPGLSRDLSHPSPMPPIESLCDSTKSGSFTGLAASGTFALGLSIRETAARVLSLDQVIRERLGGNATGRLVRGGLTGCVGRGASVAACHSSLNKRQEGCVSLS